VTAHELARLLLTLPDRPVILNGVTDTPYRVVDAIDSVNHMTDTPATCLIWE
jgi:hypothetical protein